MVWGLVPVDPFSGEDKYYIFARGTYKVGRKGCDVIITKDKGVSRIHAEIVVDAMTDLHPPKLRIRDCSKYGTFISRNLEQKENVHEFLNKEATLEDGGRGFFWNWQCNLQVSFYPARIFHMLGVLPRESIPSGQNFVNWLERRARITHSLTLESTHVLVNQLSQMSEDMVDAILLRKPIVLDSWVEGNTLSGNSFNNLIPFSKYPYRDSGNGSEEMVESVRAEKKRKQMEAIAEDLFNNQKGKRRGVTGSIHGLLSHV